MAFQATKQRVLNWGVSPDDFLNELVSWGRTAPDDIFAPNPHADIYERRRGTRPLAGYPAPSSCYGGSNAGSRGF
jgi:hypothetical protein